jgi:hypothetical protein
MRSVGKCLRPDAVKGVSDGSGPIENGGYDGNRHF